MDVRLTRSAISAIRLWSLPPWEVLPPTLAAVPRGEDSARTGDFDLGNILPYKGVLEFVTSPAVRRAGLKVRMSAGARMPRWPRTLKRPSSPMIPLVRWIWG